MRGGTSILRDGPGHRQGTLPDVALMFASTEPTAGTDSLALLARQLERGPKACGAASSALYPVVRSLEVAGLLESHVEPSSGPPRRYCHITPQGRAVRARWAQAWRDTRAFAYSVLEGTLP